MGKADLHIHTTYSYDGSSTLQATLSHAACHTDLDVIAITDHDVIDGALEAVRMAPDYGIQVVPGIEVTTAEGHLLCLFVEKLIPRGKSLADTVLMAREQGGICIAAHPMAQAVHGASAETLEAALKVPGVRETLVGLEAFNSGLVFTASNAGAARLAERLKLSPTGSSDSHMIGTIGDAVTEFSGRSARELRQALVNGGTRAVCRKLRPRSLYVLEHVRYRLLRKLGWVTWSPQPYDEIVLRRLARVQNMH